jgi:hypothetical protein
LRRALLLVEKIVNGSIPIFLSLPVLVAAKSSFHAYVEEIKGHAFLAMPKKFLVA